MKDVKAAINFGLSKLGVKEIRESQKKVVEAYLSGRDVLMVAPTGSGKSLTFQIAPFVLDHYENGAREECETVCLVIAPLVSLMKDQVDSLSQKGIKATMIGPESSDEANHDAKEGKYNVVFASPEAILNNHRATIMALKNKIGAVFIDESHCIAKWGHGRSNAEEAFRKDYSRLAEIRSILKTSTPFVALTATATETIRKMIVKDLAMKDCIQLLTTPNKENIKFSVSEINSDDVYESFQWLIEELKTKKLKTQKVIIFCRKKEHVKELYETFHEALGDESYVLPTGKEEMDDRTRLFAMYHKKTNHLVKESVEKEFCKQNGTVRVVFCTIAFGMGVNVQGAYLAIHLGPSSSLDDYLQEVGRVGRNNQKMSHAVLLKYSGCTRSKNISKTMKDYVRNTKECRRALLMQPFLTDVNQKTKKLNIELHSCCDVCAKNCKCLCTCKEDCQCPMKCDTKLFSSPVECHQKTTISTSPCTENTSGTPRQICSETVKLVRQQLMKYRARLALNIPDSKLLTGIDIATGFSCMLVNSIVQNLGKIDSLETLKSMFNFFSEDHAVQTWEIICSFNVHIDNASLDDLTTPALECSSHESDNENGNSDDNSDKSDADDSDCSSYDSDDSEVYVMHKIHRIVQSSDSECSD